MENGEGGGEMELGVHSEQGEREHYGQEEIDIRMVMSEMQQIKQINPENVEQ